MTAQLIDFTSVDDKDVVGVLMQSVLDHVVAYYENEGVDLPDRRFLHIGGTAWDCAQVSVSFIQMYLGAPGDRAEEAQRCSAPRSVVLTVEVVRKVALGSSGRGGTTPPAADHVTEHTLDKVRDAWLLMAAAMSIQPISDLPVLADVSITQPQGDYQSVVLNLSVQVP